MVVHSSLIHEVAEEDGRASVAAAFTKLQPIPGGARERSMVADFSGDVEVSTDWLKFCVLRLSLIADGGMRRVDAEHLGIHWGVQLELWYEHEHEREI